MYHVINSRAIEVPIPLEDLGSGLLLRMDELTRKDRLAPNQDYIT